jgi:hypothetical protein
MAEFVILRETKNAVLAHIQDVQELAFAATALGIIGATTNCQVVYFHLKLKKHMIDLLSILLKYGVRN